jgi:hypothetical protein
MSAASAAALRGEVAATTGAAGLLRTGLREDFFRAAAFLAAAFFRAAALLVCFFFDDVWDVPGCGAMMNAANIITARALSLRYCILSD